MGFHLKGSALEIIVHKLLVITIFTTAGIIFLEMRFPNCFLLTAVRAQLVLLQGVWWIELAYIMFRSAIPDEDYALVTPELGDSQMMIYVCAYADIPHWDWRDMESAMMIPPLYCLDILLITLGSLMCECS